MQLVKVLVVDDSALIRQVVVKYLSIQQGIQVVGTAVDGMEAISKIQELRPDVVTMDVEMPRLDGLSALKRIMLECPIPVIMLSSYTTEGAKATIEALSLGAVDFVNKPAGIKVMENVIVELAAKIKLASGVSPIKIKDLLPVVKERLKVNNKPVLKERKVKLVVIGSSTGGPGALQHIIPLLQVDFSPAVLIVQHIPEGFSKPLAEHLSRKSNLLVREAEAGEIITDGVVLVAPAGYNLTLRYVGGKVKVFLEKRNMSLRGRGFSPSVDVVMSSAAEVFREKVMGILLTGMGRDGVQGMNAIKKNGGLTIAQDEGSCVVFGMPKAAIEAGVADMVVPLSEIVAILG